MEKSFTKIYEKEVEYMYCPSCGNEIKDDAKFCNMCGEKIVVESENIVVSPQVDNSRKRKKKSGLFIAIAIVLVIAIFGTVIGVKLKGDKNTGDKISENHSLGKGDASDKKDKEIPKSEPIDYTAIDYPEWMEGYVEELTKLISNQENYGTLRYIYFFDLYKDDIPEIFMCDGSYSVLNVYEYKDEKFVGLNFDDNIPPMNTYSMYYNANTSQVLCMYMPENSEIRECKILHVENDNFILDYSIYLKFDSEKGVLCGSWYDENNDGENGIAVGDELSKMLAPFFDDIAVREFKYMAKNFKTGEEEERTGRKIHYELSDEAKVACGLTYVIDDSEEQINTDYVRGMLQEYYVRDNNLVSDDWKYKYVEKLNEVVTDNNLYEGMSLIDINSDGIPELYLYGKEEGNEDVMYTYSSGEVIQVEFPHNIDVNRIYTVDGYSVFCSTIMGERWQEVEILKLDRDKLVSEKLINLHYSNTLGATAAISENDVETDITDQEARELLKKYNLEFDEDILAYRGYYYVNGVNIRACDFIWIDSFGVTARRGDVTVWYLEDFIMNY